jgi:hypothetical protein
MNSPVFYLQQDSEAITQTCRLGDLRLIETVKGVEACSSEFAVGTFIMDWASGLFDHSRQKEPPEKRGKASTNRALTG